MKLLATAADIASTIAGIRLVQPLSALAQRPGFELRLRSLHEASAADLEWADVLVLQRGLTARDAQLLQRMHRSGGAAVCEIDDLLTQMPAQALHRHAVHAAQRWLRRCLGDADVVAVSTARLGRAIAPLVRGWVEVPNFGLAQPPLPLRANDAGVTLLFASSDRVDLVGAGDAVRALMVERPHHVRVVAVGPVADDLRAAGVAVERQAPLPRPDFVAMARSLPGGVAVIPVGESVFDACKSAIKFFDYALAGVPVICSARPPYSDVVDDGRTGWLVGDGADAWLAALRRAVDEPDRMAPLAAEAAADVARRFTLAHTVDAWQALLAGLPARVRPARAAATAVERLAERAAIALRQVNRARLARRQRR